MSHDMLAIIWFGLWGLIWSVYIVLDSYTLGIGMLIPFISRNRQQRNTIQEAVGPSWAGNEVWLVLAAGATFAAFPETYANMFSFLYVPFYLLLFSLIFRGASLELMHKDDHPIWQSTCKWIFSISSFSLTVLLGVIFSSLAYGLLIGPNGYEGTTLDLLHRQTIVGAIVLVLLSLTSGAAWIVLKTEGQLSVSVNTIARYTAPMAAGFLGVFWIATIADTNLFDRFITNPILYAVPFLSMVCSVLTILFVFRKSYVAVLAANFFTIASFMATIFLGIYPYMLPSRIKAEYGTDLFGAAGSYNNLSLMLWVAIVMVPIVIGYQIWTQWLFRKKVKENKAIGYH